MERIKVGKFIFVAHLNGGYAVPGGRRTSLEAIMKFAKDLGIEVKST